MNRMLRFFREIQPVIFNQNKEMGWHDNPRDCWQHVDLMHSEVSEGVEGLRKDLMDDHLTAYPMVACELADTIIRILDYMALYHADTFTSLPIDEEHTHPMPKALAFIHIALSQAALYTEKDRETGDEILWMPDLHVALHLCYYTATSQQWDIEQIVREKIAYNKTRADHQRGARAKPGGKKW